MKPFLLEVHSCIVTKYKNKTDNAILRTIFCLKLEMKTALANAEERSAQAEDNLRLSQRRIIELQRALEEDTELDVDHDR